ncbi:MAG: chloride channel protein [Myxococcota bacterium]
MAAVVSAAMADAGPPAPDDRARRTIGPRALLTPWRDLDIQRLWRVLLHSVLVGLMAGAVACLFIYALDWLQWLLLERAAHLDMPEPGAEVDLTPPVPPEPTVWWLVVLLPAAGGLLCGLLTTFFAPEAAGPGGDAYIDAFHHRAGLVRKRVPLVKGLASLLTIGTGGSAGREGPTAHISAGLGSLLSRWLHLNDRERRLLFVAGAAAGTGAMFRTPLGGALFAVEILYRDDFETDAIIPSVIASVTAYSVVTVVLGPGHVFDVAPEYLFVPAALPLYMAMALGLSLVGVVYITLRRGIQDHVFEALPVPRWTKPMYGGLAVGLFALLVPQALGVGYGWVQGVIDGAEWVPPGGQGALLLLGLAFAKILAVAFTIGSGGSGGEMGPSMVVGGFVGGAFGLMFHQVAPDLVPQPAAFVLVGMGAFLGGVGNVPISSLIMVCEMASSYDLLAPLMLCEGVTFVLLRRVSSYRSQMPARIDSPAHRHELTIDVLESLRVRDVFHPKERMDRVSVRAPLADVMQVMAESALPAVLVEDDDLDVRGMVTLETLQAMLGEEHLVGLAVAADIMTAVPPVRPEDDLHTALQLFLESNATVLPVMEESNGVRRPVGVLTHADVDLAYERGVEQRLARGMIGAAAAGPARPLQQTTPGSNRPIE